MPTAYSHLAGREVDTSSEAWRHECECRWLLTAKPTRSQKHLHLYGVTNRDQLMRFNTKTGKTELRDDASSLWPKNEQGRTVKPLMAHRSLAAADRILEDARRLHGLLAAQEQAA